MSSGKAVLHLVDNDDGRKLRFQWDGKDLTGWTSTCHVRQPDGTVATVAGVLFDAGPPGIFDYPFAAGALDPDDTLERAVEFELVDAGDTGEVVTFPSKPNVLFVIVRSDLA